MSCLLVLPTNHVERQNTKWIPFSIRNERHDFSALSVRTLERHRLAGTGPPYARLGRLIRYRQNDLKDWIDSNLRNSTSEMSRRYRQAS